MKITSLSIIICTVLLFSIAVIPVVNAHEEINHSSAESPWVSGQDYLHGMNLETPESEENLSTVVEGDSSVRMTSLASSALMSTPAERSGIEWQLLLGGSYGDSLFDIQPTDDGGYIAVGATGSRDGNISGSHHGSSDAWVVKIDSTGAIQWQKLYGGNQYDEGMSIRQTMDSGYVFVGFTRSTEGEFAGNHGSDDVWVVKLNNDGIQQWQSLMGGSYGDYGRSVRQTADGGYIIAGNTFSQDIESAGSEVGGIYAARLDPSGTVLWQKAFGGSGSDYGSSMIPASDGGYILVGYSDSGDFGSDQRHGNEDVVVMKLDEETGNQKWLKLLGGNLYERTGFDNVISPTSDGGYILTAQSTSGDNGDVGFNHGSFDIWVVKLYNNGTIQWQKMFGGTSCEVAGGITTRSDGGYILTAQAGSSQSGDVVEQNFGEHDIWVVRLDPDGKLIWQKLMGGIGWEQSTSIRQTPDGGYIFAGFTQSSDSGYIGTNRGYEDAWVVKLNPRLTVDVYDSDTEKPVYGAKVFLYDETNDEEQSMIAVNGHAAFSDSGEIHQYRLVDGNKYTVRATADYYFDSSTEDITFSGDGQRVIVKLTANKRPIEKTFSITNSMYYDKKPTVASTDVTKTVEARLGSAGWGDPVFSATGPDVTRGFFGGDSPVPTKSINDTTLHYHTGHGSFLGQGTPGNTSLVISKTGDTGGNFDGDWFNAQDVQNKWGGKNRWVILHSCNILKDNKWDNVLGKTHGIFGFATVTDMDSDVPDYFFTNALQGKTLYYSWKSATIDALRDTPAATQFINGELDYGNNTIDIVAAAYFKTSTQKSMDHLPDKGDIAPDGGPDDEVIRSAWNCHTGVDVIL